MSWTYAQSSGALFDPSGARKATCYSGNGAGLNNPDKQAVSCVGPIPQGEWAIDGPPFDSPTHGPYCLRLLPKAGTQTYGRSGFLIHGDRVDADEKPYQASEGCIIAPRDIREAVWASGDQDLTVTAINPQPATSVA